jgi:hypothetical protein
MVLVLSENFNLQIVYLPIPKIDGAFQDLHINLLHKSSTTSVPGRSLASHTGLICTRAAMGLAYDGEDISTSIMSLGNLQRRLRFIHLICHAFGTAAPSHATAHF